MHTIPEGEFGFCEIRLSSLFLLGMFAEFIYYTTVNIGGFHTQDDSKSLWLDCVSVGSGSF